MPEIALGPVLRTALAIAVLVAAVVGAVLGVLHLRGVPPGGERLATPGLRLDAPGLSSAPQDALRKEREAGQARLDSAGWVDRERGLAHVPIADAMDLLVARQAREPRR